MFNVLITANGTAWETDQLMRMEVARFKEYSGGEADSVSLDKPETLKLLENIPALLMYERGTEGPNPDTVRYGQLRDIKVTGNTLVFRFSEEGHFLRSIVEEFADRLDIGHWEQHRTHWAVKDGGLPKAMLHQLIPSYDVVFSFAGEQRDYVEQVADYLRSQGVRVFYDKYEQAALWGKDLATHFDFIYRRSGHYCVVFISKQYAEKMWTRHERRFALARLVQERREYILPARFDNTEVDGIPPTFGYISLSDKQPIEFGEIILEKLNRRVA